MFSVETDNVAKNLSTSFLIAVILELLLFKVLFLIFTPIFFWLHLLSKRHFLKTIYTVHILNRYDFS